MAELRPAKKKEEVVEEVPISEIDIWADIPGVPRVITPNTVAMLKDHLPQYKDYERIILARLAVWNSGADEAAPHLKAAQAKRGNASETEDAPEESLDNAGTTAVKSKPSPAPKAEDKPK